MAWNGLKTAGPADSGMDLIRGDETPQEILVLAFGMEEGLRAFYTVMASRVGEKNISELFNFLASVEIHHKEKLFGLYKNFDSDVLHMEDFESRVIPNVMEGGHTTEEFMDLVKKALETSSGVLDMAMTIEAQALDLYLRHSSKSEDERTKTILYDISEEEKAHLRHLGNLMDKLS